MRVKLACVVMAHPSRALYARRLCRRLGRGTRIVYDPDPEGPANPWRTARSAWAALEATSGITHGLVVQEDIIPCRQFLSHAKRALEAKPARVASFFLGNNATVTWQRMLVAQSASDASWVEGFHASWVPALALALPVDLIPSLVEFDDGSQPIADDEVYGRWCRLHGLAWHATIPSLVDHDDDAPSLMRDPYARGARRAACWVGECDPGLIDWSRD